MRRLWKLGASALAMLLAGSAASNASAQDDPEQGLVGGAQVTESSASADASATGGGGGGRGTPLSVGSIALWGGFRLGVGGEFEVEDGEDDLNATFGLQIGGEYVVWDYVSVGGELRWATLTSEAAADADQDRFSLFDIVVKPRGRYVFENIGLEVYGTMPLGLTIPALPDPLDGKAGFTFGVGAGVIYMFTDMIGIQGEMAWYGHWFNGEGDAGLGVGDVELDISTKQFQLLVVNAVFVL